MPRPPLSMPPTAPLPADDVRARFEALVPPHLDRLLGFASRRTDSFAEAEDAVQESCVRAWLGFAELRDASKVRPWLYRILRAVLSDMHEREGRRRRIVSITRLEDAHEELIADGTQDELFTEVAARITGEAVQAALGAIPEDFAAAVELHDIDGFKYHEIAEVLGIPIGTVMSRISRGRRLLAGALAAYRRPGADGRAVRAGGASGAPSRAPRSDA